MKYETCTVCGLIVLPGTVHVPLSLSQCRQEDQIAAACDARSPRGWRCTRYHDHPGDHSQAGSAVWPRTEDEES